MRLAKMAAAAEMVRKSNAPFLTTKTDFGGVVRWEIHFAITRYSRMDNEICF